MFIFTSLFCKLDVHFSVSHKLISFNVSVIPSAFKSYASFWSYQNTALEENHITYSRVSNTKAGTVILFPWDLPRPDANLVKHAYYFSTDEYCVTVLLKFILNINAWYMCWKIHLAMALPGDMNLKLICMHWDKYYCYWPHDFLVVEGCAEYLIS